MGLGIRKKTHIKEGRSDAVESLESDIHSLFFFSGNLRNHSIAILKRGEVYSEYQIDRDSNSA